MTVETLPGAPGVLPFPPGLMGVVHPPFLAPRAGGGSATSPDIPKLRSQVAAFWSFIGSMRPQRTGRRRGSRPHPVTAHSPGPHLQAGWLCQSAPGGHSDGGGGQQNVTSGRAVGRWS